MDISDWTNLRKYKEVGSNDGKFCKVKMFRQTESTAWKIRVSDQVIYIESNFHGTISYEQMRFLNKVCATVKQNKTKTLSVKESAQQMCHKERWGLPAVESLHNSGQFCFLWSIGNNWKSSHGDRDSEKEPLLVILLALWITVHAHG